MRRIAKFGLQIAVFAAGLLMAAPALAEKLVFDYRLSPALKAVLDSGNANMIDYDAANPRNVVDVIAVRGRSAQDWTEALVIIARTPDRKVSTALGWAQQLQEEAKAKCSSTFTELARDEKSITLERRSINCPAGYPHIALYRAVAGKQSLFLLSVLVKDDLSDSSRGQWLAMMSSARIE